MRVYGLFSPLTPAWKQDNAYSDLVFVVAEKKDEKSGKDILVLRQQFVRLDEKLGDFWTRPGAAPVIRDSLRAAGDPEIHLLLSLLANLAKQFAKLAYI